MNLLAIALTILFVLAAGAYVWTVSPNSEQMHRWIIRRDSLFIELAFVMLIPAAIMGSGSFAVMAWAGLL
jgi:hypothetical protein